MKCMCVVQSRPAIKLPLHARFLQRPLRPEVDADRGQQEGEWI
jgi:hypothetical protein